MRAAVAVIMLLVNCAASAQLYVTDSIRALFDGRELDPAEGVWQWPDDGAVMLITRRANDSFTITLLDSPRCDIAPGTVAGTMLRAPGEGYYDATLAKSTPGKRSLRGSTCEVRLMPGGRISFTPYRSRDTYSLYRLVPYFFRVGFRSENRPSELDGAIRLYPTPADRRVCL